MEDRIPTSVLSIVEAKQEKGEKLTTLICRMTGTFKPFTDVVIFPGERKFQVRDITQIEGDKHSVKVKGIPFKNCTPFAIITPLDLKVRYNKVAYFIPTSFHNKDFFPGEYSVTGGIFTGYRMFNKEKSSAKVKKLGNLYCVNLPFKSPLVPGAIYTFENTKGFKGEMVLVYPGDMSKKSESIISSRIEKFRSRPGVKGIYSIILRTDNYVELPGFLKDEEFDGSIKMGATRIMEREYNAVKNKIIKQSKASGGVLFNSVKKSCNVTPSFFHAVLDQIVEADDVYIEGDYLVNNGPDKATYLSPLTKESYKLVVDAGIDGISRRTIKDYGMINCFYEIKRMRLAVVLDDDLYYSQEAFKLVLGTIFKGRNIGEPLTIQDIRDSSGLSRRYIIALLNRLEDDNIIHREENDDRVIKTIP
ncbi:MAG: SelB C-terminal domain-containing protein [Spirochaetaceae bacterium]